jgi:hypothetical protein
MSTTETIPAGYRQDAQGRLVPEAQIKPVDAARDALVREIVGKAKALNFALHAFRVAAFDDIQAFAELSAERYGAKLGGKKGNISLVSFDGRFKVMRCINETLVFDERLQAAKVLVDECLKEWAKDARPEIHALINDAFQVDKQGHIDTDRVLSLRRLDIKDARWEKAMEAIAESLSVASSRTYLRVYERVGDSEQYRQITLDLASA